MTSPKYVIAYLAGTFLVGAAAGGWVGYHWKPSKPPWPGRNDPEHLARHLLDRLTSDAELTPVQAETVRPIVTSAAQEMVQLHKESMKRGKEVMDRMTQSVETNLSPTQCERWSAKRREFEEKRAAEKRASAEKSAGSAPK